MRITPTRLTIVPLMLFITMLLAACPPRTSIEKLDRNPGRYAGKEVTIAGRVTDSFGALGRGVFQIDDGTGTMWVLAGQYGLPASGAKVAVTGHVEQGFSLAGRNFATILRETERRH
jgi:RecJ-like exonuclease